MTKKKNEAKPVGHWTTKQPSPFIIFVDTNWHILVVLTFFLIIALTVPSLKDWANF